MDEGLLKVVILLLVGAFVLISKLVEAARAYRKANIKRRQREDRAPLQFDAPVVPPPVAPHRPLTTPVRRPKRRRRKPQAKPQQQPVKQVVRRRAKPKRVPQVVSQQERKGWDQKRLRDAIVLREILGPPKALRGRTRW